MPLALSCWTGSHETWISKAVIAVALMLSGPAVGSVKSQWEVSMAIHATNIMMYTVSWYYTKWQICSLFIVSDFIIGSWLWSVSSELCLPSSGDRQILQLETAAFHTRTLHSHHNKGSPLCCLILLILNQEAPAKSCSICAAEPKEVCCYISWLWHLCIFFHRVFTSSKHVPADCL